MHTQNDESTFLLIRLKFNMEYNITDSTYSCWNNRDNVCMIFTPPAFGSILIPIIFAFYELTQKRHTSTVVKALGLIYASFAFLGTLLLRVSFGQTMSSEKFPDDDTILFYIALSITILFSVAFILDFFRVYRSISIFWKIMRLVTAVFICIFAVLLGVLNEEITYKIAKYTALYWTIINTTLVSGLLFIGIYFGSKKDIPIMLYIFLSISYTMWAILLWIYAVNQKTNYVEPILITGAAVINAVCYIVGRILMNKTDDNEESMGEILAGDFGKNIKADSESNMNIFLYSIKITKKKIYFYNKND